ncbi:MAG TPA: hypothetical protein VLB27_10075, partial [candidate division Zixibacteria bacterium]|nr:hypothetical protein [candidate division Zixibacteria bacterium]
MKSLWSVIIAVFVALAPSLASAQDVLWERRYGGVYNEGGFAGARLPDGGYALLGSTFSYGAGDHDIFLVRVDSLGQTQWSRTYGGSDTDYGYDIQPTVDGGFVLTGVTRSSGAGKGDVCLIKVDSLGALQWQKTYGGAERDEGWSVRQTIDRGYIIGGTTGSFGAGYTDMYLLKVDSLGALQWQRTYGGAGGENGAAVRLTPDGGFALVGST